MIRFVHGRIAAALFLAILTASAALGQKSPAHELGFRPDRLYQFDEVDTVNLFNGNLAIVLPLGPEYPVGGQFKYQLKLVYNSKVWDYDVTPDLTVDSEREWVYAWPNLRSNAGVGWRLSLGRLVPPTDPTAVHPSRWVHNWTYEGPSGEEHAFSPTLPGDTASSGTDAAVMFSQLAKLRLVQVRDSSGVLIARDLELPSGETHRFQYLNGQWRLTRQSDRFGNKLEISYTYDAENRDASWTITDSQQRSHVITFTNNDYLSRTIWHGQVVSSAELHGFEGVRARYEFVYTDTKVPYGCGHDPSPDSNIPAGETQLPLLTRIVQPDGSRFAFDYWTSGNENICEQAALKKMTLPAGGTVAYTYQRYVLPQSLCGNGTS